MGFDIINYKTNVDLHVEKIEKNQEYSLAILNKKLNNYCLAVKGDLQYKFYEFMQEKSYTKDEMKEHDKQVQEVVNMLSFRTEYSDAGSHLQFIDEFKFNLNHYVNEYITIQNPFEFSDSKEKSINNLNKKFTKECNLVVKKLTKLCNKDMLESLTTSLYSIISAQAFEKNKHKSIIEDMIEQIEKYVKDSYTKEKREQIIKNSKKYLDNIIKVYKNKMSQMENETHDKKPENESKKQKQTSKKAVYFKDENDFEDIEDKFNSIDSDYFQNVSWQNKILKNESATNVIIETTENRKITINEYNLSELQSLDDHLYNDIKERLSYLVNIL